MNGARAFLSENNILSVMKKKYVEQQKQSTKDWEDEVIDFWSGAQVIVRLLYLYFFIL